MPKLILKMPKNAKTNRLNMPKMPKIILKCQNMPKHAQTYIKNAKNAKYYIKMPTHAKNYIKNAKNANKCPTHILNMPKNAKTCPNHLNKSQTNPLKHPQKHHLTLPKKSHLKIPKKNIETIPNKHHLNKSPTKSFKTSQNKIL